MASQPKVGYVVFFKLTGGPEEPQTMLQTILVVGATGKQGRSFIEALGRSSSAGSEDPTQSTEPAFRVLALTRKASGPRAQRLAKEKHVEVVEGDLDSPESIRKIFEDRKNKGGIWGVYCVLAYPGVGANDDGEERQGKMVADLALEYGVSTFVYSSDERAGEKNDEYLKLSWRGKASIERHVKSLTEKGLSWTIMHPGFFLDNFEGFMGAIAVALMANGLKPDTTLGVVDSVDIGRVAAAIFRNPDRYKHEELVVIGDVLTMSQLQETYKTTTGRPLRAIPAFLARALTYMNKLLQDLMGHFEWIHSMRESGQHEKFSAQLQLTREAYPEIKSVQAWALAQMDVSGNADPEKGSQKISLWGLLTSKM
ncbi:NAD(P)-binding protein [Melanogaster broomeanus]|nr:NAD(P)-binding protein [Melanogaster broomeanus]